MNGGNSNSGIRTGTAAKVEEYYNKGFTRDIIIGLTGLSAGRISQIISEINNSKDINVQNIPNSEDSNICSDESGINDLVSNEDAIRELELVKSTGGDIKGIVNNIKSATVKRLDNLQKTYDGLDSEYNDIEVALIKTIKSKLEYDIESLSVDKLLNALRTISSIERRGIKFARDRVINQALDSSSEQLANGGIGLAANGTTLVQITLPTNIVNNFMITPDVKLDSTNRVIEVDGKSLVTMSSNTLMENTVKELPQSIIPEGIKQIANVPSSNSNKVETMEDADGNVVSINHNSVIRDAARSVMNTDRYNKAFNKESSDDKSYAAEDL